MNKVCRFARMLAFFAPMLCLVLISQNSASATSIQEELTLHATCGFLGQCDLFISNDGLDSPTSGSVNFDPVAPGWSIDFTTANAIVWCYGPYGDPALGCNSEDGPIAGNELYGPGGSFSMTGPKGLGLTLCLDMRVSKGIQSSTPTASRHLAVFRFSATGAISHSFAGTSAITRLAASAQ